MAVADSLVCASRIRSPRSNSSTVTPKRSAIAGSSRISGMASSRSQRLMALLDTARRSATSCWVSPCARRRAEIKEPSVFFSIVVILSW